MDRRTISKLDAINRTFYERHAESFDATRRRPWVGWERVVDHLVGLEGPSILDVGCGNGRFGLFAERRLGRLDYVGVDRSRPLLERARRRGRAGWRWLEADLVGGGLPSGLGEARFDLVVCFGVLHHLPGESVRRRLLRSMVRCLGANDLLAVSFWQLGEHDRFTRRAVETGRHGAVEEIEPGELEEGDYLLPWGEIDGDGASEGLRYCHHVDAAEAARLLAGLGLEHVDSFLADGASGDLNLYYLLRCPA